METWHNRLEEALSARNKTWLDLYDYVSSLTGVTKQSVYAWKPDAEARSKMVNGDNAAAICAYLGINGMWLFHKKGHSGLETRHEDERIINLFLALSPPRRLAAEQTIQGLIALERAEKEVATLISSPVQQQVKKE